MQKLSLPGMAMWSVWQPDRSMYFNSFFLERPDGNIVVDPLVFRSLGIRQVPAVTYLPGVQQLQHCEQEVFESASVVYGAASVAASLKAVAKDGVAVPQQVIAALEGQGWETK